MRNDRPARGNPRKKAYTGLELFTGFGKKIPLQNRDRPEAAA